MDVVVVVESKIEKQKGGGVGVPNVSIMPGRAKGKNNHSYDNSCFVCLSFHFYCGCFPRRRIRCCCGYQHRYFILECFLIAFFFLLSIIIRGGGSYFETPLQKTAYTLVHLSTEAQLASAIDSISMQNHLCRRRGIKAWKLTDSQGLINAWNCMYEQTQDSRALFIYASPLRTSGCLSENQRLRSFLTQVFTRRERSQPSTISVFFCFFFNQQ